MDLITNYIEVCERAARAGGAVLLDWMGRFSVREKGRSDLVTEADLAAKNIIRETLLGEFPDHGFLAEEDENIASPSSDYRWIVDPLDGTLNYVHSMPNFSVSIALEQRGELVVGTVFDPGNGECYCAAKGRGAFLNGRRLAVSTATALDQALVAVSFAASVERGDPEIVQFLEILQHAQGIRRMGSSALNLSYLAAGRFDGYWSKSTKIWDIAAGALLVSEAGGMITDFEGGPLAIARPQFIAAATPALHRQLREVLWAAR